MLQKKVEKMPKLRDPVLIEGLPGMGQVGKIAVDFLIDTMKPKLLYKIHSHDFWHSVYFNDEGFVELPSIALYYSKGKTRDYLFLAGDDQPNTPRASYEFSEKILDMAAELGCKEVVTLGGIGLASEVKVPKVFGAATDKGVLDRYKKFSEIDFKLGKKVEAIVGASGLLLGLARLRNMGGIALLSETYGHPSHLGFKEAKSVLIQLKKITGMEVDLSELDKESAEYEKTQSKIKQDGESHDDVSGITTTTTKLEKLKTQFTEKPDVHYIG
ncbi:MAG: PAC2 family protein [Nanoarchaeota archaeon]